MKNSVSKNSTARILVGSVAAGTILIGLVLLWTASGLFGSVSPFDDNSRVLFLSAVLLAVGGVALLWIFLRRGGTSSFETEWGERIGSALRAWNERDDVMTARQRAVALVLVSLLGLFFELVLIRLLGSEIKVFAFLKNVVLIAAFLGLGLGFFIAPRRTGLLPLFLPASALLLLTVVLGGASGLLTKTVLPGGEEIVLLGLSFRFQQAMPLALGVLSWIPYYAVTLFYFLFVVLVFIPLGQYTGKCMRAFAPIPAYSMNLAGALAGTLLFAVVSFVWLPPLLWFALVALLALWLARAAPQWVWRANVAAALVLVGANIFSLGYVWSPYNKLVVSPLPVQDAQGNSIQWGYQLGVGEYYYQDLVDLSDNFFAAHPSLPVEFRYSEYEVPYAFLAPERVLILGAGTGNDVAAALRRGAQHVDAVDIDPGIIEFGKQLHPEKPYADARVSPHANDARAFLKNSEAQYDLVLFGLLDSQQVLSAFGSVRLDNFVYTVEGMRDAFARVKPNGMLVVTFELFQPWMGDRIAAVLEQATGHKPIVLSAHHGTVFLIRNGAPFSDAEIADALKKLGDVVKPLNVTTTNVMTTSDDWPYLYLRERTLPLAYWTILPLLGLVSVVVARRVVGTGWKIQWRFFLLGAAFMLMEVRIIAQIALLFGSTWLVNAVAISAVLLMAMLANLLVARLRVRDIRPWAIFLLLTLVVGSLIPSAVFLSLGQVTGGIVAALLLALPIFFAGMVFSGSLARVRTIETAMASNLLGSILGGLVEYTSLLLGIGALAWLAVIFYVLALFARVDDA